MRSDLNNSPFLASKLKIIELGNPVLSKQNLKQIYCFSVNQRLLLILRCFSNKHFKFSQELQYTMKKYTFYSQKFYLFHFAKKIANQKWLILSPGLLVYSVRKTNSRNMFFFILSRWNPGAFEIFVDGQKVFSKLERNGYPIMNDVCIKTIKSNI